MTLSAAACIAHKDPAVIDALPDTNGLPAEIIVQRGHRNAYDRAFRTAGARIVEVGLPLIEGVGLTYEWQIEAALTERTVAIAQLALADADGVPLRRVCEIAAAHDIPVIVDAAAELPPSANLRRFVDEGAALVAFSGGKAIRGPQGSGILAGRRDLIASVRLQTLDMDVDVDAWTAREGAEPPHHGLGRSMKVGKEQIVGAAVALREFAGRDHEAEAAEHAGWLESLVPSLSAWPVSLRTDSHFYPRLLIEAGVARARPLADALAAGTPPIVVPHAPLARGQIVICPEAITIADRQLVEQALAELPARTT
jgi:L-seryl-tRNA(Ser) seleniumtransferase